MVRVTIIYSCYNPETKISCLCTEKCAATQARTCTYIYTLYANKTYIHSPYVLAYLLGRCQPRRRSVINRIDAH